MGNFQGKDAGFVPAEFERFAGGRFDFQRVAAVACSDRKFASSPVDQHREFDAGRTSIVEQLVERGTYGATGIEHVVDQDDVAVFGLEWNLRAFRSGGQAAFAKIITMEGYVDCAEGRLDSERVLQTFSEPCSAGMDADQCGVRRDLGTNLFDQTLNQFFGVRQLHGWIHPESLAG